MDTANRETSFKDTGAVEQDRPEQKTNVAPLEEQLDHRYQDPLNKTNDSGLPGHGQTPEFTGEEQVNNQLDDDTNAGERDAAKQELTRESKAMNRMDTNNSNDTDQNAQNFDDRSEREANQNSGRRRDPDGNNPEGETVNQDPGERQKENQNSKKDDDLAA
jgi:hypothetical protein